MSLLNRTQITSDPIHTYYNITIANGSSVPKLAQFKEVRQQPFLRNSGKHCLSITRFFCQTNAIPIQIVPLMDPTTDPDKTIYSVTLSYNGFDAHQHIMYVTREMIAGVLTTPQTSRTYYHLKSIQHMVDMVNTAFSEAFDTLGGLTSLPVGAVAPYFTYDSGSYMFTLHSQALFYDTALSTPIQVFVNTPLYALFGSINNVSNIGASMGKEYQYLIANNRNNIVPSATPFTNDTEILTKQEHPTLVNWMSFVNLVFMSSSLPIVNEDCPVPTQYFTNQLNGNNGIPLSRPIITDFVPAYDIGIENLNLIQYSAGIYRYIDMEGSQDLKTCDLSIYWQDKYMNCNLHELYLMPNDMVSVKIMFIPKDRIEN